ncbi:LacI family DNA-binding transcriptional regulator [Arthrobacter terrae]|uniref:LacI family DNA-binding transcriptional regulator n=1 Tax=Arthrobacter terrae TaxID=2935737 RepID=UPI001E427D3C|nr:LacI family DNA-binding transcriptional regulator [Arthrobacter terrae]
MSTAAGDAVQRGGAPQRRATINDIAAVCGVAAFTVSRAFSTPWRVNVHTRERIDAAAAQRRYIPGSRDKVSGPGRANAVAGYTQLLVDTEESEEVEARTLEQVRRTADGAILTAPATRGGALGSCRQAADGHN